MAKEIEVKVLNVDLEEMEKRLVDLGAKLISEEYQTNTIFDSKDNYIQNNLNSYLRIRETKNLLTDEVKFTLTLKKNISKEGIRENIEVDTKIYDKESMIEILNSLRYEVIEEGHKHRLSYLYDNIRFDLDTWDKETYPYPYMEIEVEDKNDLEKAIKFLKINKENISTKSIIDLKNQL